jgi:hypothetical protein
MNGYLVAAAAIAFVVGLVHSVLGEMLVFQRLRRPGHLVTTQGRPLLGEGHVRIVWASWHIVTVFGWCVGAVLLRLSWPSAAQDLRDFVMVTFAVGALAASALVFCGTRAKHPGWIGLLAVAVCAWLGGQVNI